VLNARDYYSADEVASLGLASYGRHVFIHRTVTLAGARHVSLGDYVRIDAHTLIVASASVTIGSRVHVGSAVNMTAAAPITIADFAGISAGSKLFTTDDDYGGEFLTGPTVPAELTNIATAAITIGRHVIIGSNSVVLPGAVLEEGVVIGALSLAKGRFDGWGIYGGVPARRIRERSRGLLEKEGSL
jgi:galactoside O-acetyltransferase